MIDYSLETCQWGLVLNSGTTACNYYLVAGSVGLCFMTFIMKIDLHKLMAPIIAHADKMI